MPLPHPLPDPLVELIAQRFRVMGEPARVRILDALRDEERSVQELTQLLHTTQQNVSKHLGILHTAGIVSRRKEGVRVLYAIADDSVFALCEHVCGGLQRQLDDLSDLLEGVTR